MFLKNSRYKNSPAFSPLDDGTEVFSGVRGRAIGPATGVIEHVLSVGDRLDQLARHYYNNDRLWWRIVDANPQFIFAANMFDREMAGQVILIPKPQE